MKMKKIVTLILAFALVAALSIGATVAFLTASDEEVNTFTVGNVKIDLIESQYHRTNAGVSSEASQTKEEPLSGGYLWAPKVQMEGTPENTPNKAVGGEQYTGEYFSDAQIEEDAKTYKDGYFAEHAANMVPGDNVRKCPYVKNTGKNPAYIRVRALVPADFDAIANSSQYTQTAINQKEVKFVRQDNVKIDGIAYNQYTFTYVDPLQPNALTFWNVWGNITIDQGVTNEQLAAVPVDHQKVIFQADAIQSEGFATAEDAFAAFDAAAK